MGHVCKIATLTFNRFFWRSKIIYLYSLYKTNNMTSIEFIHNIAKRREPDKFDWEQAKEMYKKEILLFAQEYDEYVFRGGSATMEQYYQETFKN